MAATAVMVQFGSFETQEEAQERLSSVKSKYTGVLGSLPMHVREVTLPPDNLKVYRTQAGPLPDRTAAQSICTQLASSGDECYVAETAMTAGLPPATIPALTPSTPATVPSVITPIVSALPPVAPATVPVTPPMPQTVELAAPAASSSMNAALDKAVAEQPSAGLMPAEPAVAPAPAKPSFWSRMNPFSSTPAPATAAPATPPPTLPEAAPVEPVIATAMPAPAPLVVAAEPAPLMEPPPAAPAPAPVIVAQPMQLPPPPAPLIPKAPPIALAAAPAPVITPVLPPADPVLVSPTPFKTLSTPVTAGKGDVRVEEATRVPLSESSVLTPVPVTNAPISLHPASTLGRKTLWAQIGTFEDTQAALAFWDRYRQTHPDFPAVRVRATAPLQAVQMGNGRVWLRVGPFAQTGFISNLCSSIKAVEENEAIACGRVTDLGIAGGAARTPGLLPGSRYNR